MPSRLTPLHSIGTTVQTVWRSPVSRWIFAVAFLVCLTGWVLAIRPLEPVWGPVGTWVGGLATSGGLVFAGLQIRDARWQRADEEQLRVDGEAERRKAMARSVSVSANLIKQDDGTHAIDYTLVNGGDYPIDRVVLVVTDWSSDECDPAKEPE